MGCGWGGRSRPRRRGRSLEQRACVRDGGDCEERSGNWEESPYTLPTLVLEILTIHKTSACPSTFFNIDIFQPLFLPDFRQVQTTETKSWQDDGRGNSPYVSHLLRWACWDDLPVIPQQCLGGWRHEEDHARDDTQCLQHVSLTIGSMPEGWVLLQC